MMKFLPCDIVDWVLRDWGRHVRTPHSQVLMPRFHTAIAIVALLLLFLFPLSGSDSSASLPTIEPSLLPKWVLYPIVSDIAIGIAIAIAKWKLS